MKLVNKEDRFWEAHKKYIDVHLNVRWSERIDLNYIENLEQKEYEEEGDFLPLEGRSNSTVVTLEKGDFLNLLPRRCSYDSYKVDETTKYKESYI